MANVDATTGLFIYDAHLVRPEVIQQVACDSSRQRIRTIEQFQVKVRSDLQCTAFDSLCTTIHRNWIGCPKQRGMSMEPSANCSAFSELTLHFQSGRDEQPPETRNGGRGGGRGRRHDHQGAHLLLFFSFPRMYMLSIGDTQGVHRLVNATERLAPLSATPSTRATTRGQPTPPYAPFSAL